LLDRGEFLVGQRDRAGEPHARLPGLDEFEVGGCVAQRLRGCPAGLQVAVVQPRLREHEAEFAGLRRHRTGQQAFPGERLRMAGDGLREGAVEAAFPRGIGLGIRRTILHGLMVERAAALGVRLLWGARVSNVKNGEVEVNGDRLRCRWIIGADGQNSRVRSWAGLASGRIYERRIGLRRHFRIRPWSEFVEIYWGEDRQAYITPIGSQEICVALISRQRFASFDVALEYFPQLWARLRCAAPSTPVKGAMTVTRRLKSVVRGPFVLIGEASGSADAITGEGLAVSFRQASALGRALAANDLSLYAAAHQQITALPHFLGRSMLLMDKHSWVRRRALGAFAQRPGLFARLLSVHVGELPLRDFGISGILNVGWRLLTA